MSLIESLNSFFKNADIKNVNLERVLHFIKEENGEDTILNEFWYDLLKKSCKDNVFYIEDFCDLFNKMRFCENDVEKFLDSEYSGNKEILINDIINIKKQILGNKCQNINFDLLLIDAIWGLDPNDSMFLESWKSICYEVDKVEQEIHKPDIDFGNTEYNIISFNEVLKDEECVTEQLSGVILDFYA